MNIFRAGNRNTGNSYLTHFVCIKVNMGNKTGFFGVCATWEI
jgi:hypothetical protein